MPHAGLLDEQALGPVEGPLQRSRLHLRGGRRRLRQGKTAAAIVTLYDALEAALEWRTADRAVSAPFAGSRSLYRDLVASGALDGSFDFDAFDRLAERALDDDTAGVDAAPVLAGVEAVLTALGVLPFDEASLPPEDPGTF